MARAAIALAGGLLALGCASLPFPSLPSSLSSGGDRDSRPDPLIRPDAPPEYDVLVAQQFELEGRATDALAAYERAVAKDGESAYLHRKLAESLARHGRHEDALHQANLAFEIDPDDSETRMFLGQLYRLGRNPEAAERVLRGEDGEPLDPDAAFLLYQVELDAGNHDEALALARWLVEAEPDSVRGQLAMAAAWRRMEEPEKAEAALRSALERDPGNLRIYVELARSARERGDHDAEIAVYREILEHHPHNHSTLIALADAQMSQDDLEGALQTFEEIEERYPEDLRSSVRLGFLYYEARRYDEAAERFERALEVNPDEPDLAYFLGVVQRRSGRPEAAIAAFERIPADHKEYANARTQIAAIYERSGEYDRALAEVRAAAAATPSRELDLYEATLRSKAGDFDGAVRDLEGLLAESPEDDELLYNLGVVYGEAKRTDEALDYMEQALTANPDNASALNYVGYTWAEKGIKLDEAQALIERAIGLRPEDGYIVDSLGWVYYMRARPLVESGREAEGRKYLKRALAELERADELTGGDPVVSEHLGDAYLLLDDKVRALEKFEEALRLDPRQGEQPDLHDKLEALRRELR